MLHICKHTVVRTSTVKRGQSFMKAAVYLPDSAYKTKACYSLLKDSPNDTDAASVKNLLASVGNTVARLNRIPVMHGFFFSISY